jgi:hypothetical protein
MSLRVTCRVPESGVDLMTESTRAGGLLVSECVSIEMDVCAIEVS